MLRTLATGVLAAALLAGCGADEAPDPVATSDVPTTERVVAPQDDTSADGDAPAPTAAGAIRLTVNELCTADPTTDGTADLVVHGETELESGTSLEAVYVVDIPAEGSPPARRATADVESGEVTFRVALYGDGEQGSLQSIAVVDGDELLVDGGRTFDAERLVADDDACD